jgi:hypothetical protein
MTCPKITAVKQFECLKVDIGGAFLCANIDEEKEVFLQLDHQMTDMVIKYMPEYSQY